MHGKALRQLRTELGWTIKQLAEKTGYSWSSIQRMEIGNAEVSSKVVAILEALGHIKQEVDDGKVQQ